MIAACNTANIVKKNKGAITSQNHSYISALRQFGNLVTPKADKAEEATDTHWHREPLAVQLLLAGNVYPDPDLLQCNWNSMEIKHLNCANWVWTKSFRFYTNFKPASLIFFFPQDNNIWSKCYQQHGKISLTAISGFFAVLLCCSRKCWIQWIIECSGLGGTLKII